MQRPSVQLDKDNKRLGIRKKGTYGYFLADSAYDSQQVYRYIFDRSSMIPVIDTNKRKGISLKKQSQARWLSIQLRQIYAEKYKKRWEIERTINILQEYFDLEYI
ncbi:MAG: hypothetical protein DRP33_02650 [Thermotogae bacterium]|nr:MAG: hypothetical protein DRP33_02650 [Thermotogota bacterium]